MNLVPLVAAASEKLSGPQDSRLVMYHSFDTHCRGSGTSFICSDLYNLVFNTQQQNTDIPYLV